MDGWKGGWIKWMDGQMGRKGSWMALYRDLNKHSRLPFVTLTQIFLPHILQATC